MTSTNLPASDQKSPFADDPKSASAAESDPMAERAADIAADDAGDAEVDA
ncbi:MAG: hypothetical protein H0X35_05380, partial [Pseudonocardiales bacterium]|nr:hypothetical protein [Pseudonocardiales bacterium]